MSYGPVKEILKGAIDQLGMQEGRESRQAMIVLHHLLGCLADGSIDELVGESVKKCREKLGLKCNQP